MPPPIHVRVTHSGVLGDPAAPQEIFSFGYSLSLPDSSFAHTAATMQPLADAAAAAFAPLVDFCTNQVTMNRTRCALVIDGRVDRDPTGQFVQADSELIETGSGATEYLPLSTAMAVSLQSNYAGPTGRGRFYLPCPQIAITRSGRFDETTLLNYVSRARLSFRALLDSAAGAGYDLVVASGGSVSKGIPPLLNPVTLIRIGSVPDVMRSRRNAQDEGYLETALA